MHPYFKLLPPAIEQIHYHHQVNKKYPVLATTKGDLVTRIFLWLHKFAV
jgi:hypothetical protein